MNRVLLKDNEEITLKNKSLKKTVTDQSKKDYVELYKQSLVESNRLRSRISSMEKYRESWKVKYESTKKRLDEVIGNKAREKYCHNK